MNYPVQFSSPYDEFKSFIAQKFHEGVVEKIFIISFNSSYISLIKHN